MIPRFKLRDTGNDNKLYAFLTLDQANDFCDSFERPYDLIGVGVCFEKIIL